MARFQFRLATLRRLREQHRDELRGRLAEAYEAEQVLQRQRDGLQQEAESLRGMQQQMVAVASPNVNQLLEAQRYGLVLQGRNVVLAEQLRQVAAEVERRRQAVVEADRQVRALDKLAERQHAEFLREQQRIDHRLMDEIAGQRQGAIEP